MWRYVAGGIAALLMTAAGWLIFSSQARPDSPLPAMPAQAAGPSTPVAADDPAVALPAAPERSREQKRFDRYDKDRNAGIAREEYLAPRRKAFAKLDVNGDGRLSFEEWAVKTTDRFAAADRDGSGVLTAAEFATTRPKRAAARPRCVCPPPGGDD
ncbi:histidine kinase [Sphingomonas sp. Leaf412]|uniref:EF-hand domain-containing protein n=1 Tax=Sphingomonas sp. Leaf412 TaxID=1736370 RepID=UPI00070185A3|nr:histidine kinase [Sphingomonas sp. Leaf412]KQT32985.1 histidine kinase [Sphingomonas sp. Leaf412]